MYKQDSRPRLKRGPEGLGRGCANAHITKRTKLQFYVIQFGITKNLILIK